MTIEFIVSVYVGILTLALLARGPHSNVKRQPADVEQRDRQLEDRADHCDGRAAVCPCGHQWSVCPKRRRERIALKAIHG